MVQSLAQPASNPPDVLPPWREVDLTREPAGTWSLDGVPGLPGSIVAVLVEWGRVNRLALFGRVLSTGVHDFGAPVGPCPVVVCEKWAGVWLKANAAPWDVQGVNLATVAALIHK